jgi:nitroimidazol reductase NimA-like FMN-containing flavoprotein (pyridoxamine 5'-phosphate oxidase superfamily)
MPSEQRSLEAFPRHEAVALLASAPVGRVVFTVDALPAVVPVTFSVRDSAVVIRTSTGSRLARAADGGVLAFEADEVDEVTRSGWSVVVTGVAELVTDPVQQAAIRSTVEPFAPGDNEVYVRLPLTVVTGRRVTVSPPAA